MLSEVLYREGLALGLDKGGPGIRERVVLNMKANARMQAVVDAPPEAELRAWFDARRDQYDQPRRYQFQEIEFRDRTEDAAREADTLQEALARGEDPLLLGQMPTPFPRQAPDDVRAVFGCDFLAQLETMAAGDWQVIRTDRAWYVVELQAVEPARQADFAALRDIVEEDWRREQQVRLAANMLRGMRANYDVRRPDGE